jgi:hypothetical protein
VGRRSAEVSCQTGQYETSLYSGRTKSDCRKATGEVTDRRRAEEVEKEEGGVERGGE